MFALVDCNNFYASCERVFRPELNGKAIVVLSNNDGCVIARSNEAKALGVPMGIAAFKCAKLFHQHQIHVFSSNFALYGDMSNRVMTLLSKEAPEIEIYSIDEAFLKFEKCDYLDLESQGRKIHDKVFRGTGIPVSVGIAPTKALSKIANKIAKQFSERTKGLYIIDSEEKRMKALKWFPIEDVWGIGPKFAKLLIKMHVKNAYQFTQLSDSWVKKNMSIRGLRLKKDLLGIPTLDLEELKSKKNIATTRSFEKSYTEYEQVKERITTFASSCAEKLRNQSSSCTTILIFIHTNNYHKEQAQYHKSILVKLPFPTNSSIEITQFATNGLKRIFKKGFSYKKAGVIVMDIVPTSEIQLSIFANSDPKHEKLMQAIDATNKKLGQQKIKLASQSLDKTWKMKQEKLSPNYTTQLNEIINVKS